MDTITAIETRRAVKHFDPTHTMTAAEEKQLLSLAIQAPTAFNIQNWRPLVVKDPSLRQQIRDVSWGQAQVTDASLFIILCADLRSWDRDPKRYWQNAIPAVQEFLLPAIDQYYRGKDQVQRDEAMRSCGMMAQTLMLTAKAMGYDSCPMDGFDFEAVGKLINLPNDHVISMYVAIGKATQEAWPRGGQLPLNEVVTIDKF
jgi:nitroreductase